MGVKHLIPVFLFCIRFIGPVGVMHKPNETTTIRFPTFFASEM